MFDFNNQVNAIMGNQQMLNTYFTNLQNQFTPGYKAETLNFNDLMGQQMAGRGAKVRSGGIVFTQGAIAQTQNPTDLAIDGNGFFLVSDGNTAHMTRDGRFRFQDGVLTHSSGMRAMGFALDENGNVSSQLTPIRLDLDPSTKLYGGRYTRFHFDGTGKLYGEMVVQDSLTGQLQVTSVPLYQMAVGSCANPSGLRKTGTTTFGGSDISGQMVVGVSGQGALGRVVPGSLEMANIDFAQQASLIGQAKQNYEANFAAFKAMDKMTENAIGLVR